MAYKDKIFKILPELEPGEVYDAIVYHDDWCGIHKGKDCSCQPDIKIKVRKVD